MSNFEPALEALREQWLQLRVGQVYVRTGGLGQRITVAAVSDTHGTDKEGYPWALESFRNGVLTLLSDTSPDTPLCDCRSHGKPPHMRDNLCAVPAKSPPVVTAKAPEQEAPSTSHCDCAMNGECNVCRKPVQPKVAAKALPVKLVTCPTCNAQGLEGAIHFCPKVAATALACIRAQCATPDAPVLKRHILGVSRWVGMCDPCWFSREQVIAQQTPFTPSNAPPKPEPLPVVEWLYDWLPEAGR